VLFLQAKATRDKAGIIPIPVPRLSALLLLLCGILLSPAAARAQISPGPLSRAHQSLEGPTQCNSCHQFGASTPTFKCLECHKEIAQRLSVNKGFHAQLGMKNPNGRDCVRCHLEHNGEDFNLVHWEPSIKQFDHRQTGYPLVDKHAGVACEKCHMPAHIAAARALIKEKDLSKSYLGLSQDCATCHSDPHKGQLGPDCERCHNIQDWKQAKQFDHSKTKYPLAGAHAQVACEKCHFPSGPDKAVKYTGLKFDTCIACHTDPHKGAFKGTCESCHTTASWKKVNMSEQQFDHSKTKYPLLGAHAKVGCDQCHANGDFKKQLAFAQCIDCHTQDPHKGQFQARASKGECAECHKVEDWKPSLFGVKEHTTSKYPLEGKHAAVACEKCHTPAGKDTLYKVKFAACTDCHKDAHDNQFAATRYQNRCEDCHTVKDFHRSTFTIAKHKESRFVLTGAHVAVPCAECHKAGLAGRADKILPFHFNDRTCAACHADPHKGEFKDRMAQKRADGTALGCEACHTSRSWIDIRGFDHSKTKFALAGAHRAVGCTDCHKVPAGSHEIQFKGTPTNCDACHTDAHGGQFAAKDGITKCGDCHVDQRWAPSTFDHDKGTQFPLTGAHADVGCPQCHTLQREVQGKTILFYKPTPKDCAGCHGADSKPA
jgi:hypothetical protein